MTGGGRALLIETDCYLHLEWGLSRTDAMAMSTLTEDFPKRLPLSMLVSVALHGAVIAGLLFASFHQTMNVPPAQAVIDVSMVAPEVQPEAAKSQPQPEHQPEKPVEPAEVPPQPAPEPPVDKPVPIEKPRPVVKPKPVVRKPHEVKKPIVKPHHEVKPVREPVKEAKPTPSAVQNDNNALQTKAQTAPETSKSNQQSISDGKPQPQNITLPAYPARALAFHLEGRVQVQFDVDNDGRVVNARIIDSQPKMMFDREVRIAMTRWRYKSGSPGTGLKMTIVFKLDGSSSVE